MSLLATIVALAVIDSVNPTSITGAIYLAGSGQTDRLRRFIFAVFCTYLSFGLALMFGPAAALRAVMGSSPTILPALIETAAGALLVGIGIRTWHGRGGTPAPSPPVAHPSRRSGLALGMLATVADLPTAAPLLAATALVAAANAKAWTQIVDLSLYDVVYVAPLVAVACARAHAAGRAERVVPPRARLTTHAYALAATCVAVGTIVTCAGVASLV